MLNGNEHVYWQATLQVEAVISASANLTRAPRSILYLGIPKLTILMYLAACLHRCQRSYRTQNQSWRRNYESAKHFRKILTNWPQNMQEPRNRSLKKVRDIHESSFHHQQKTGWLQYLIAWFPGGRPLQLLNWLGLVPNLHGNNSQLY